MDKHPSFCIITKTELSFPKFLWRHCMLLESDQLTDSCLDHFYTSFLNAGLYLFILLQLGWMTSDSLVPVRSFATHLQFHVPVLSEFSDGWMGLSCPRFRFFKWTQFLLFSLLFQYRKIISYSQTRKPVSHPTFHSLYSNIWLQATIILGWNYLQAFSDSGSFFCTQ